MNISRIEFGGFVLELALDGIDLTPWPFIYYAPFRSQKKPDIRLTARPCAELPLPSSVARLLFDGDSHWQLFQDKGGYVVKLFDPKDRTHNKTVFLSHDFQTADIYLNSKSWLVNDIFRPLAEILSVLFLSSRGGLLVHGAAIRDHDRAYVFIGYSGAGKTTISKLWGSLEGDFSVIGDERIIVRRDPDGWHVYGTPWPGMGFVVANERVPLSNVFFIRHGKKNEIIEPSKAVLFQDLFTQVFAPFWNPEAMTSISDTCQQLVEQIPSYQLPFVNDISVTEFVREFTHAAY